MHLLLHYDILSTTYVPPIRHAFVSQTFTPPSRTVSNEQRRRLSFSQKNAGNETPLFGINTALQEDVALVEEVKESQEKTADTSSQKQDPIEKDTSEDQVVSYLDDGPCCRESDTDRWMEAAVVYPTDFNIFDAF
ncbi:predicted protein [Chaetoceros tenuissimus]|uniref:Uncharacterized protein n=1 Tax=Chaetoceros tenuissimus TaxID=426638 RepID=A0AAD3D0Y1_9STRA|nr:predicted protein [Chaetoceros tenuissimus]